MKSNISRNTMKSFKRLNYIIPNSVKRLEPQFFGTFFQYRPVLRHIKSRASFALELVYPRDNKMSQLCPGPYRI